MTVILWVQVIGIELDFVKDDCETILLSELHCSCSSEVIIAQLIDTACLEKINHKAGIIYLSYEEWD